MRRAKILLALLVVSVAVPIVLFTVYSLELTPSIANRLVKIRCPKQSNGAPRVKSAEQVSGEGLKEPERVILKYGESGRVDRSESRDVDNGGGESQRNASVPAVVKGVELELKKLAASVERIHENLVYLRNREMEMRDVSEKTNSKVAWYSIMSLGVCIAASAGQLWHLQGYFRKKKLI